MTFILGTGKLSYDYFGDDTLEFTVTVTAPEILVGDVACPGLASPGTHMIHGQYDRGRITVEVQD